MKKTLKQILNKPVMNDKEIATKHNVSVAHVKDQIEKGKEIEKEHSSDPEVIERIARRHTGEDANYYNKMKMVERKK